MQFLAQIKNAREEGSLCVNCPNKESCRGLLLETPLTQLSLVMNSEELNDIQDLIEGTIFQLNLDNLIDGVCGF